MIIDLLETKRSRTMQVIHNNEVIATVIKNTIQPLKEIQLTSRLLLQSRVKRASFCLATGASKYKFQNDKEVYYFVSQ